MDLSQEELPTYSVNWKLTDQRMELGCINLSDPRIKTEFNNFEQRKYDYAELEKEALAANG